MTILVGFGIGFLGWFLVSFFVEGLYTVDQNERAVKTVFGRAQRIEGMTTLDDPISACLSEDHKQRYTFPQLVVIPPGGPYFKFPWERVYKVNISTQTVNMAWDPESPSANNGGTTLEAVTKDQLDTRLTGQIRYRVCEKNLYAYLFGVKNPIVHVMGYFISVLRERIANFEAPGVSEAAAAAKSAGQTHPPALIAPHQPGMSTAAVSINDLRKNLHSLNEIMNRECCSSEARYGITLEASLITAIDPPNEVEKALAAINTAYNQVSSDISLAQASADQQIVQSRRAVEIETLKARSEIEPLQAMADQLAELKKSGDGVLRSYLRNLKLQLYKKADRVIREVR